MASFQETFSPKQFQTGHYEWCGCWPKHWTVLVHIFDFNYASMLAFNRCSHNVSIHCLGFDRIWHGMPLSQAANVYEAAADASSMQQRKWILPLFDFVVSILGGFDDVWNFTPYFLEEEHVLNWLGSAFPKNKPGWWIFLSLILNLSYLHNGFLQHQQYPCVFFIFGSAVLSFLEKSHHHLGWFKITGYCDVSCWWGICR